MHEKFFVPILMYGSEKMLWREKKKSSVRAVQMDNLRGLLGFMRMERVPNTRIKELYGVRVLMKASYCGSAMRRGWRGIGSSRESM